MKLLKKYPIVFVGLFLLFKFIKPGIPMVIIGSLVFYMLVKTIKLLKKLKQHGVECVGTITSYQRDSDGHKTPVVEFTSLNGKNIAGKPAISATTDLSKIMSYKGMTDRPVIIIYNPDDPEKFILKEDVGTNDLILILLFIVSLVFVIAGVCNLVGYIKID